MLKQKKQKKRVKRTNKKVKVKMMTRMKSLLVKFSNLDCF